MDKKISQLTAAAPLTGTEVLPVVQSGQTVKTTIDDILNAESITYAQATTLMGSGGLTPGKSYLLSNFQTVHYIVDSNGSPDLNAIITGTTEPLVLTAASTTTFSPVASSTTFPQDIIHVDLNPNNWLKDISFADVYGTGDIVPGFKGVITYRHDTRNNNKLFYDFRNCKFRRYKINHTAWNSATTYNEGNIVVYSDIVYVATITNTNVTPNIYSTTWIPIVDCTISYYLGLGPVFQAGGGDNNVNLVADLNDYVDVKTFVENGDGTYEGTVFENTIGSGLRDTDNNYYNTATLLPNIVFYLPNTASYTVHGNYISADNDAYFGYLTVANAEGFDWNVSRISTCIIGRGFSSNKIDIGSSLIFGATFNIGGGYVSQSVFGLGVTNNIISKDWGSVTLCSSAASNSISYINNLVAYKSFGNNSGNFIANVSILGGATLNNFGQSFIGNNPSVPILTSASSVFQNNTFVTDVLNLNFSTATHVYQTYACTVYKKPNGTFSLTYINNSDVVTVAGATS